MDSFMADTLRRLLPLMGATVVFESEYERAGYITFSNGARSFFRENKFELNPLGSINIAKDKALTTYFLKRFGYSAPEETTFWGPFLFPRAPERRTILTAVAFAEKVGFPVFVKPNDLSQGKLVFRVDNPVELIEASFQVFKETDVAVVQRFYEGRDYRIVVLDGEVISAYERIPLTVEGDGTSTIALLLDAKQAEFRLSGRDTTLNKFDRRIRKVLQRHQLTLTSILGPGVKIRLHDIANLSLGATCRDITHSIHSVFRQLALKIAEDLCLRLCGIDVICDDLESDSKDHVIIEVNSAPGIDNYQFPDKAMQNKVVDQLYLKVLRAVESRTIPKRP